MGGFGKSGQVPSKGTPPSKSKTQRQKGGD